MFFFGFLILKTTVFNTHATLSLPKAFTLSFNICSAAAIRFESLALFQREFTLIYLHLPLKGTHVCTRSKTQLNQLDLVFVFPLIIYNATFRLALRLKLFCNNFKLSLQSDVITAYTPVPQIIIFSKQYIVI